MWCWVSRMRRGNTAAGVADALPKSKDAVQRAVVEGLFRSAESLTALGQRRAAAGFYEAIAGSACDAAKEVAVKRAEALGKS